MRFRPKAIQNIFSCNELLTLMKKYFFIRLELQNYNSFRKFSMIWNFYAMNAFEKKLSK